MTHFSGSTQAGAHEAADIVLFIFVVAWTRARAVHMMRH